MSDSSDSADSCTIFSQSRCWGSKGVSSTKSVMPMMALSGVRISWLTLARNPLLARLAASAASLAWCSSASARLRSVISRKTATPPRRRPASSRRGVALAESQIPRESVGRRRYISVSRDASPCMARERGRSATA